jgi:hypothetical protein
MYCVMVHVGTNRVTITLVLRVYLVQDLYGEKPICQTKQ